MSSVSAAIGYGYTSFAALILAKKEKNISITISGIMGVVMSIIFVVLLLVPISGLSCSLGVESYVCLAIWSLLGLVFYNGSHKVSA